MQHNIVKVTATPVFARGDAEIAGVRLSGKLSGVIVEIETSQGVVGHGFTAITDEAVVAAAIDHVAAPNLVGMNVSSASGFSTSCTGCYARAGRPAMRGT
ncbi:hypothetical protein CSX04_04671 [Burkholderia cepacia]|nr:hypothetical protein CSX04_04671 [Burkholderia cepacia]